MWFLGRQKIAELLLENGASVNFSNDSGYTALHWASYQGNMHFSSNEHFVTSILIRL